MRRILFCFALLLSALSPSVVRAVECTEIAGGGVSILAAGVYCMGSDMIVDSTSGNTININADNVVLDCRGYRVHNNNTLSSGNANGVGFTNRRNVKVRNCRITGGFAAGICAYQDNGLANVNRNLVFTNNDVSGAFWYGIFAYGTNIEVSNNRVSDIGGRGSFAMGIRVGASILSGEPRFHVVRDNIIARVQSTANYGYGIYANNTDSSTFTGNQITATRGADTFFGYGIRIQAGAKNQFSDNHIIGVGNGYDVGIQAMAGDACFHNFARVDYDYINCSLTNGNF